MVRVGPAPLGGLPRGRACLGSGCPGPAVGVAGCLRWGLFPPVQREKSPHPNTPLLPSPLMYNVRAIHLCIATSLLYVNQEPLLRCMIGVNPHNS